MSNKSEVRWSWIIRRFWWDLLDRNERLNLFYSLVWQIPGSTGDYLRVRHLAPRMKKVGKRLRVQSGTRFRSIENLEVGDNVTIGFDNFFQAKGGLKLGDNVICAPGVKIWTTNHNVSDPDVPVRSQGHTNAPVVIEDDVFIASNAFILPGTTLSRGCVVSAGAVVSGKVYRPYSILGGNPARVIGYRGGMTPDKERGKDEDAAPMVQVGAIHGDQTAE